MLFCRSRQDCCGSVRNLKVNEQKAEATRKYAIAVWASMEGVKSEICEMSCFFLLATNKASNNIQTIP